MPYIFIFNDIMADFFLIVCLITQFFYNSFRINHPHRLD